MHGHCRLKTAGRNWYVPAFQTFNEIFVQGQSFVYCGRGGKGRPASLAAIAVQGELRDDQDCAVDLPDRAGELAGIIGKDAQADNFLAQIIGVDPCIICGDAQEDDKATPDLTRGLVIDVDACLAHPLNHRAHRNGVQVTGYSEKLLTSPSITCPLSPVTSSCLVSLQFLGYDPRMYPVLLRLGPITIYSYGVMMALSFLAAGWVLGKELQRQRRDPTLSSTLVLWAAVGGLFGARLLFLIEQWQAFLADPWSLLFTGAGFTWYGGLIGGVGAVTWCIQRYGLPWLEVMDAIAPAIALGHGIGRIGCHLAGDGDWGPPTTLPWGVAYTQAIVGWDFPPGVRVHPTALYEMVAYLLIFAFLWGRRVVPHQPGALFWGYLLLAGSARFLLEFVRVNPPLVWGLSQAQVISVVLVAIGAFMLLRREGQPAVATPLPRLAREKRQ